MDSWRCASPQKCRKERSTEHVKDNRLSAVNPFSYAFLWISGPPGPPLPRHRILPYLLTGLPRQRQHADQVRHCHQCIRNIRKFPGNRKCRRCADKRKMLNFWTILRDELMYSKLILVLFELISLDLLQSTHTLKTFPLLTELLSRRCLQ